MPTFAIELLHFPDTHHTDISHLMIRPKGNPVTLTPNRARWLLCNHTHNPLSLPGSEMHD